MQVKYYNCSIGEDPTQQQYLGRNCKNKANFYMHTPYYINKCGFLCIITRVPLPRAMTLSYMSCWLNESAHYRYFYIFQIILTE